MKLLVTVDKIESNKAVLLLREAERERPLGVFPLETLPAGIKAGDLLSLSFEKEEEETAAARQRIHTLHQTLKNQ